MIADEHRPVRVTPTHAGPDSKGMVSIFGWDLEGLVAFYIVGGGVVGLVLVFALVRFSIWSRLGLGALPVALAAAWVRVFVHGRPPAYQRDVFEKWIRGRHFGLRPQRWCRQRTPHHRLRWTFEEKAGRHA